MTYQTTSGRVNNAQSLLRAFQCQLLGLVVAVALAVFAGCQPWHQSTTAFPGSHEWKQEKKILKQARNDPFPTPEQVGLK